MSLIVSLLLFLGGLLHGLNRFRQHQQRADALFVIGRCAGFEFILDGGELPANKGCKTWGKGSQFRLACFNRQSGASSGILEGFQHAISGFSGCDTVPVSR
ncbi:MAG: hypothetical protein KDJ51_09800, partial [Nitratireductor sp.]|nr:hypothetical protein [Nitratireductor sp.]